MLVGPRERYIRLGAVEAALTALGAGPVTTDPIEVAFPSNGRVTCCMFSTEGGTDDELAGLWISIQDPAQRRTLNSIGEDGSFVNARALVGQGRRWFVLDMPVKSGISWRVRARNSIAGLVMVPEILLGIEAGR